MNGGLLRGLRRHGWLAQRCSVSILGELTFQAPNLWGLMLAIILILTGPRKLAGVFTRVQTGMEEMGPTTETRGGDTFPILSKRILRTPILAARGFKALTFRELF